MNLGLELGTNRMKMLLFKKKKKEEESSEVREPQAAAVTPRTSIPVHQLVSE